MHKKWSTFRSLPEILQRILVYSLPLLPLTKLSLYCFGLNRTQRLIAAIPLPFFPRLCSPLDPVEVAGMTSSAAALLPWDCNCLPRALIISHLLTQLGIPCDLRIGVSRKTGETLEAHAWVECQGRILDSMPEETRRFDAFPSLSQPHRSLSQTIK
jgi:Transglutaminase-like superfamily